VRIENRCLDRQIVQISDRAGARRRAARDRA